MKKTCLFILTIFIVSLTSCLKDGDETIILPERNDDDLPEVMMTEWNIAIKCKLQDEIAIEAVMVTQNKSENFTATGSGNDYDGQPVSITVTGTYDKEFNTISAKVRYDFEDTGTYRIDHFAVDLDFYTAGTYIDMIKIEESNPGGPYPSCETQIKLFY